MYAGYIRHINNVKYRRWVFVFYYNKLKSL
jgi:hypothetical protein